jgi:hypothetical protein
MRSTRRYAFAFALIVTSSFAIGTPVRAQDSEATSESTPPPRPTAGFAPVNAPATGFGATGQWVLTMSTLDGGGFVFLHKTSGGGSEINIHPALDTFIATGFSVGGVVGIDYQSGSPGATFLDIGARAGYDLPFMSQLSLWPMVAIFARHQSVNHASNTSTAFQASMPFLWHPAAHAFAGLGPSFILGLSGGSYKQFGIDFILGGWL